MKTKLCFLLTMFFLCPVILLKSQGQSRLYYETGESFVNRHFHKMILQENDDKIYFSDINSTLELNRKGELLDIKDIRVIRKNSVPLYYEKDSLEEILVKYTNLGDLEIYAVPDKTKEFFLPEYFWLKEYELAPVTNFFKGPGFIKKQDGNFFLIDRDHIRIINRENGEVIESKENPYEQPATIVFDGKQYLLPASRGSSALIGAIDENGNPLWGKTYNGIGRFDGLKKTSDGFIAIGDSEQGEFLLKLNETADSVWIKYFTNITIHDIVITSDMGFALIGEKSRTVQLVKTDALGNIQWEQNYGEGIGWKIIQTEDEGYAIGARFRDEFSYFIKTDKNGQTSQNIKKYMPSAAILEPNNTRSIFSANGLQFFDINRTSGKLHFEAPIGSSKNTLFGGGLWLGGKDFFDNTYMAAEAYKNSDFEPGIRLDSTAFFNQVWQVYASEIQSFRADFSDGTINNGIPYNILKYPAKGNPNTTDFSGIPYTINIDLAPFVDVNADSIYNPMDGDYPSIKGDHALWWITNDANLHSYTRGFMMDVEVQYMVYGYNRPDNPLLHNTIFVEAKIKNNSELVDYPEFYMGQRVNFEIGCLDDDFVGSYPKGHFFYGYNADDNDAQDETCIFGGDSTIAYGNKLPVQTAVLLDNEMSSFTYYQSSFENDTLSPPFKVEQHFNMLTGKWKDGTLLTEGGLGYSTTNAVITPFAFSGNPANSEEWSMCIIGDTIIDPEFIGSTGPHYLPRGAEIPFSMAYTYFDNVPHPCPNIEPIAQDVAALRCFYNAGNVEEVFTINLGNDTILSKGESLVLDAGEKGATYQWSNEATSQQITITEPGTYAVTVTAANGCEIKDEITIDAITSTHERHLINTFSVFPNPTSEVINISIEIKEKAGDMTLQLLNHLGQEVIALPIIAVTGIPNNYTMPIQDIAPGTYFLSLNQEGIRVERRKVIVVR